MVQEATPGGCNPRALQLSAFLSHRYGYNAGSSSKEIERQEENSLSRAAKSQPTIRVIVRIGARRRALDRHIGLRPITCAESAGAC